MTDSNAMTDLAVQLTAQLVEGSSGDHDVDGALIVLFNKKSDQFGIAVNAPDLPIDFLIGATVELLGQIRRPIIAKALAELAAAKREKAQ